MAVVRRYQVLQGKNRYYCGGYCIGSKNIGVFLFALFLIFGVMSLFFAFDCPYLATNVSIAIPIVGAILFVFVLSLLLRTACSDPGILPRSEKDEQLFQENRLNVDSLNNYQMPRIKEINVKGKTFKQKYCYTCKLYRPPRSSHCSICDNCVERFDHHCPWVANCVEVILKGAQKGENVTEILQETPGTVIEIIICFFSMWSIICLCGYHTHLASTETSTNEDIKDSFLSKRGESSHTNPYDRGSIFHNFCYIICGPNPPSLIDLRGIVRPKYQENVNGYSNTMSI